MFLLETENLILRDLLYEDLKNTGVLGNYGKGMAKIYVQTWSGNTRMMHVAEKCGFEPVKRKTGIRTVGGMKYDGLTYRLSLKKRKPEGENRF